MPVLTNSIEIASEASTVFAFASDLRNEPQWNPECLAVTKVTEGPVGLGARYRAKWKGSPELVVECVAYDAPRTWTSTNGGPISITATFTVTPKDSGAILSTAFNIEPRGIGRLFARAFVRRMTQLIPENLAAIKGILEAEPAARL
jgi:hypothetical protein